MTSVAGVELDAEHVEYFAVVLGQQGVHYLGQGANLGDPSLALLGVDLLVSVLGRGEVFPIVINQARKRDISPQSASTNSSLNTSLRVVHEARIWVVLPLFMNELYFRLFVHLEQFPTITFRKLEIETNYHQTPV